MRIIQYKIMFIVFALATASATAQKTKLLIQEFKVKPNVVIDVNTRYTDIEIETWNKNEVLVEARMKVTGENITEEIEDSYYDKWKFDATGNTDKIKVISRTNRIDIHSLDLDSNIDLLYNQIEIPDVSIASLDILNSMDFEIPEIPEIPEVPEVPEVPEIPEIVIPEIPPLPPMPSEFDFDAYKKDKSYLERWKKENKDILGENAEIKVLKNSLKIKSDTKNGYFKWNYSNDGKGNISAKKLHETIKSTQKNYEKRLKAYAKRQEAYKQSQKERLASAVEARKVREESRKNAQKIRQEALKSQKEARKLALVARQEAQNVRRKEIQRLLKSRTNIKVKRVIKIKAPKGAKFNMNVKYGAMSFPKN